MDDILTYVIIVLFFIFLLYFIYTVVDVFFLSKRNRKVKSPVSHVKKEDDGDSCKSTQNSPENEKLDARKPFDEDSNKTEIVEDSDDDKSEESKDKADNVKENISSKTEETESADLERKSVKEILNKQTKAKPKKKFSLFSFVKKEKKKPVFEREKIDEKYHELIVEFVDKNVNGWNQSQFYEFVANLVKKGYDRRPSEIVEDLEIVKKEMVEERRVKDESNLNYSDTSDESENLSTSEDSNENRNTGDSDDMLDESSERESAEKDLDESKNEKEQQDKLKELAKKNKESVDTRSELDKTLEEIRAIRKRLSEK